MGTEIARKLATIRKVAAIEPIPKADRIVVATVDGWKLVTQKSNNFQVGDLVVYFEIDSFLPIHPAFEFLRDSSYKNVEGLGHGFRLKTIKLRGQISQGLILPLKKNVVYGAHGSVVQWLMPILEKDWDAEDQSYIEVYEGDDVTEVLKVQKYEQPVHASLAGVVRSTFPSWIRKTDQERVQNLLGKFKQLPPSVYTDSAGVTYTKEHDNWLDHTWEVTMKLDGSSMTVYYNSKLEEPFGVCSRNMDLLESESNAYWKVANRHKLWATMMLYYERTGRNIAIQGELMGPGVQGNGENLSELEMFVFDVFDIDKGSYLNATERDEICMRFGLKHVPVLSTGFVVDETTTLQDLLELANGASLNALVREGIVFKSEQDPDISFKVINDYWLLNEK